MMVSGADRDINASASAAGKGCCHCRALKSMSNSGMQPVLGMGTVCRASPLPTGTRLGHAGGMHNFGRNLPALFILYHLLFGVHTTSAQRNYSPWCSDSGWISVGFGVLVVGGRSSGIKGSIGPSLALKSGGVGAVGVSASRASGVEGSPPNHSPNCKEKEQDIWHRAAFLPSYPLT